VMFGIDCSPVIPSPESWGFVLELIRVVLSITLEDCMVLFAVV